MRTTIIASSLFACSLLASCGFDHHAPITQTLKLKGGKEISIAQLTHGREKYTLYCRPCHGDNGDGRGPAGIGLRPPPRNFKEPVFKFGGVEAGNLPPDEELMRIVKVGLHGTAMYPWQMTDGELVDILQYIKTFSPVWTEEEPAKPVAISEDPWKGKEAGGIQRGKIVYHGLAQCSKCHPAYATKEEIWNAVKEATGEGSTSAYREDMYNPDAKLSDAFQVKILPPDFLRHPIKAGSAPKDLFRTIAAGIGGTAMPMWKDSIDDADIWAIAYYVQSIYAKQGLPEGSALRKAMLEQPEWTPPEPPPAEGEQPAPK
jgi:mono/diheme cytochrome c family protein